MQGQQQCTSNGCYENSGWHRQHNIFKETFAILKERGDEKQLRKLLLTSRRFAKQMEAHIK